jgi:hypothetical protein
MGSPLKTMAAAKKKRGKKLVSTTWAFAAYFFHEKQTFLCSW